MSHATLAVILPRGAVVPNRESASPYIDSLMAQYDENLEVPEYAEACYCKGAEPGCDECHGTGTVMSTCNPKSKWDWWVVGGRWAGHWIPEYDTAKDNRNYEKCWMCHGTGKRNDAVVQGKCNVCECNVCDGSGIARNFHNAAFEGDVQTVSHVLGLLLQHEQAPETKGDPRTLAVLTPDGQWHEGGELGWWGMISGKKDAGDWGQEWKALLEAHAEHIIVLVDYHI